MNTYHTCFFQAERDRVDRQTEAIYRKTQSIKIKNQEKEEVSNEVKVDRNVQNTIYEPFSSKPIMKERPVSARGGRSSLFNKSSKSVEPSSIQSCIQVPCSLSNSINYNNISGASLESKSVDCQNEIDLSETESFEKMSLSRDESDSNNKDNSEETGQGLPLNDYSSDDNVTVVEVGGGAWG